MPRNFEVKYKVADLAKQLNIMSEGFPSHHVGNISQCDTFFVTRDPNTRMKLRQPENQLIIYNRADEGKARQSSYSLITLNADDVIALKRNLWNRGEVEKHRQLYVVDRTRIHLDKAQFLGDFVEIEIVLEEHEQIQDPLIQLQMKTWIDRLGLNDEQVCELAYIDLLETNISGK